MEIVLVGTDHGDWKGKQRLEETLASISPDVVAVEMSHEELSFLEKSAAKATKYLINVAKKKGLSGDYLNFFMRVLLDREALLGYEYCTAERHCQKTSIPFMLIDDPKSARITFARKLQIGRRLLNQLPSSPESRHVSIPSIEELNEVTDREYERAAKLMKEPTSGDIEKYLEPYKGLFIGERDSYMAARIQDIDAQFPESKLAVIVVWAHMLDDPKQETLYTKIKGMKPKRILINEPESAFQFILNN